MPSEYTQMRLADDLESGEKRVDDELDKLDKDDAEYESDIPDPKVLAAVGALMIVIITGLLWYTHRLRPVLLDALTKCTEVLYIVGILLLFIGGPLRALEAKVRSRIIPRITKRLKHEMIADVRKLKHEVIAELALEVRKIPNDVTPRIRDEIQVVPTQVASKVMIGMGEVEKKLMTSLQEVEARLKINIEEMPKELKNMLAGHLNDVKGTLDKHMMDVRGKKK